MITKIELKLVFVIGFFDFGSFVMKFNVTFSHAPVGVWLGISFP